MAELGPHEQYHEVSIRIVIPGDDPDSSLRYVKDVLHSEIDDIEDMTGYVTVVQKAHHA